MNTFIPVENGDALDAVRGFLRKLMDDQVVDAVFCSLRTDGGKVYPSVVTDSSHLNQADPLTPVMTINGARAVSSLTRSGDQMRLAAVLRPCEIRGLLELVKLKQASLENTTIISVDCPGTYEAVEFYEFDERGKFGLSEFLQSASRLDGVGIEGLELREACQMCTQPVPEHTDIHLHLFGFDTSENIPVTASDKLKAALEFLGENEAKPEGISTDLQEMLAVRQENRQGKMAEIQAQIDSDGGFCDLFDTCIRCHNCMTVCPICYCKTCLFRTQAFDHPPEHYYGAARRKGALRMLPDTILFHLTRLNHMGLSCVSCGMCTSACPMDIPVGAIFTTIGSKVQAAFDYSPGLNIEEPIPLTTFKADEWTTIGES